VKSKAARRKSVTRSELPDFVPPALATLRKAAPDGEGWLHEIKFDGYRIEARLDHGAVRLLTRKGLDWTDKFPSIAAAVGGLPAATALLDGELVAEDEQGVSSFAALQASLKASRSDRLVYYVFDLLFLDGDDFTGRPLIERKAALTRLLSATRRGGAIRLSEHFEAPGPLVLRHACSEMLEGIVSKRKDSPYLGGRSERWIKAKCSNRQELVVVGYAPSSAEPRAIGALVVGYYDGGKLRYAGRIGTGYSRDAARKLWRQLQPLKRDRCPVEPPPAQEQRRRSASQAVAWVEPRLVIEADFRSWTSDRLVRQAVFQGVREDKPAREVVRELPARPAARGAKSAPKLTPPTRVRPPHRRSGRPRQPKG
jgi:bifunctional non-homologous end joining protein LigD